jgi:hypothetical protein
MHTYKRPPSLHFLIHSLYFLIESRFLRTEHHQWAPVYGEFSGTRTSSELSQTLQTVESLNGKFPLSPSLTAYTMSSWLSIAVSYAEMGARLGLSHRDVSAWHASPEKWLSQLGTLSFASMLHHPSW